MRRAQIGFALLSLLAPAIAHAQLDLAWNDCYPAGGVANRAFACNSESGADVLVGSFRIPAGLGLPLPGTTYELELQTAGSTLPNWWQAGTGQCRASGISPSICGSSCLQPFACDSPVSMSWTSGYLGANRAQVMISVSPASAASISPSIEYEAFRLDLSHAHATGAGACAGCDVAACISFNWMLLPGIGDPFIRFMGPGPQSFVTWQGGAIGGAGCPAATPARRTTWGAIHSLYR